MLFIWGDDNRNRVHKPVAVYVLISINVLIYLIQLGDWNRSIGSYSVVPVEITTGDPLTEIVTGIVDGKEVKVPRAPLFGSIYFTLITACFIHGSAMHILGNMFYLWVFGDQIEDWLGSIGFVVFYLANGILANFAYVYFNQHSAIPALGASGAIAAVLGAYLVVYPKNKIDVWFLYNDYKWEAWRVLAIWFGMQLFGQLGARNGVAYMAHIGGFVLGVATIYVYNLIVRPSPQSFVPVIIIHPEQPTPKRTRKKVLRPARSR